MGLAACDPKPAAPAPEPAREASGPAAAASKASNGDEETARRFLQRYAASYDYAELLAEPEVKEALRKLLGAEQLAEVEQTMGELRVPIDVVAGNLVFTGFRRYVPQRTEAAICVSFQPVRVHVGLFLDEVMTVHSHESEYRHVPRCLRQWVQLNAPQADDGSPFVEDSELFKFRFKSVPMNGPAPAPVASAAQSASAP